MLQNLSLLPFSCLQISRDSLFTAGGGTEFLPRDKLQGQGGWSLMSIYIQAGSLHTLYMPPSAITSSLAEEVLSPFSTYRNTRPSPGQLIWHIVPGPSCLFCTSGLLCSNMSFYLGTTPTLRAVPTSAPLTLSSWLRSPSGSSHYRCVGLCIHSFSRPVSPSMSPAHGDILRQGPEAGPTQDQKIASEREKWEGLH